MSARFRPSSIIYFKSLSNHQFNTTTKSNLHQNGRLLWRLLSCLRLRRQLIWRRIRCLLWSTVIMRQRQMQPEPTQVIMRQRSMFIEKPTPIELRKWSVRTLSLLVLPLSSLLVCLLVPKLYISQKYTGSSSRFLFFSNYITGQYLCISSLFLSL